MINEAVKQLLSQVFAAQALGVLSTASDDQPYSNLVAFTALDNLDVILFVTPRGTAKYKNLVENKRVSILVDTRSNTPSDFDQALVVTALGQAYEVGTDKSANLKALHRLKHPALDQFIASEDCALFQVKVSRYILVRNLRDVSVHSMA